MKINIILVYALLAVFAASCSSAQGISTPVPTPLPSVPPPVPEPATFEYEYEIVNTRATCEPDLATWAELLSLSIGASDKEAAQKAAAILQCTQAQLQSRLSQRGEDGWRLVTFETLSPAEYDLGIEYTYRLVWEREQ